MGGKRLKFPKRQKYRAPSHKEAVEVKEHPKEEDVNELIRLFEKKK